MAFKDSFDRADPNVLADLMRLVGIGEVLRGQIPQALRMKTAAADVSQLATLTSFGAIAMAVTRAYARVGPGGTPGVLAVQAAGATPANAQIAVAPNGDIVVLTASGYTGVDIDYIPARGDLITLTNQVVTANVWAVPARLAALGVIYLRSAEATAGALVGYKVVIVPGGVSAVSGQVNLNVAKSSVQFVVANAVTRADITLLVGAEKDLDTVLEGAEVL